MSVRLTLVTALGALLLAAGCAKTSPDTDTPSSLRDVAIPADFTFATTRPAALTVRASAEALGTTAVPLLVLDEAGQVLYRGPLRADHPLHIELSLPLHEDALEVHVGDQVLAARVEDGAAELTL